MSGGYIECWIYSWPSFSIGASQKRLLLPFVRFLIIFSLNLHYCHKVIPWLIDSDSLINQHVSSFIDNLFINLNC